MPGTKRAVFFYQELHLHRESAIKIQWWAFCIQPTLPPTHTLSLYDFGPCHNLISSLNPVPPPMHTQTHSTLTLWFCCKPATRNVAKRISANFTKINILLPFRFKNDTWKNSELSPWMMMFSILTFYVFDQKCRSVTLGQIIGWTVETATICKTISYVLT